MASLKEENRKLESLNDMLMSDKRLLSDLVGQVRADLHQRDAEISELRAEQRHYEESMEQYRASIHQIQGLYEREVSNLRTLLERGRESSSSLFEQRHEAAAYGSSKPTREYSWGKSGIRKNQHLRLTSEYSLNSREVKRLELSRELASDGIRRENFSQSSRHKSQVNLQREVNELYGIVHNAKTKALK